MKKNLIICLVAACGLMFGSCKKTNYAEDFVGNYNVTITPTLTVTIPVLGNQAVPMDPITTTCTIALNGDDGDVTATMNGQTFKGTADKDGLQLDPNSYSGTIASMGSYTDVHYTVNFTHPVIKVPTNGTMSWNAPTTGTATVTISGQSVDLNLTGTTAFVATKSSK